VQSVRRIDSPQRTNKPTRAFLCGNRRQVNAHAEGQQPPGEFRPRGVDRDLGGVGVAGKARTLRTTNSTRLTFCPECADREFGD
jgi:hypothetical protein